MKTGCLQKAFNLTRPRAIALLAVLLAAVQTGCGGGGGITGTSQSEDEKQIYALIGSLSDRAANMDRNEALSKLREAFTGDNAPSASDVQVYKDRMFEITDKISVSGNTATFTVRVAPYDPDKGKEGTMQWKAVKEGTTWKVAESPLP